MNIIHVMIYCKNGTEKVVNLFSKSYICKNR
nr:MAG TPA: hypothetical protein [Caudoviricetes sp.]